MRKPRGQFTNRARVIIATALTAAFSLSPAVAAGETPQIFRFDGEADDGAGAISVDGTGNSYLAGAVEQGGAGSSFAVVKVGPDGAARCARATTDRAVAWAVSERPARSRSDRVL